MVLVFSFGNIGKVNASSEDQSGKELAIELIENSNAKDKWKEFSEDDKSKVKEFAKLAKKVERKVEQNSPKNASLEEKNTVLNNLWDELSENEQLAFTASILEVETEVEVLDNGSQDITTMASGSNSFVSILTGKTIIGVKLYTFQAKNLWYYDGVRITSNKPSEVAQIHQLGWSYEGKDVDSAYFYNGFDYWRHVVGHFALNVGGATIQHDYPTFEYTIRANGAYSISKFIG
ncbi:hypothetical protein [Bacillus sp. V33-4]|uniref:hypothetical protein n=1 Tax=Bacillus sp. V33-4 TaxID=2054169 RepID=UPI000C75BF51|nr:hypothetical protein [Bacillus sp. V33-4]PLR82710.1 hypothetical protein CVD23_16050 [Bacillus sp. V33-4]